MNISSLMNYTPPTQMVSPSLIQLWLMQGAEDASNGIHDNPYAAESISGIYWQVGHDQFDSQGCARPGRPCEGQASTATE